MSSGLRTSDPGHRGGERSAHAPAHGPSPDRPPGHDSERPVEADDPLEGAAVRRWILVADDDKTIRRLLVRVLTDAGYAVVAARNGVEALDLAKQVYPHLIILDLRMPRMSGIQFLANSQHVPVIVLSGFLHDLSDDPAAHPNVVARLEKPVSLETLRATVQRALRC
jgi:chemosensory pili system protein ChpA (sensor histidine kinase/response regulator)